MNTDFSWMSERSAGVLAHISSLPSRQGIGNFGEGAFAFIDFLKKCGMKYWQICPLNPTGYGDSPYQSFSAFAGNTYFIDLSELVKFGLLEHSDISILEGFPHNRCDFGAIYHTIPALLKKAYGNFSLGHKLLPYKHSFADFCKKNSFWLEDYSDFMVLKNKFKGLQWTEWDNDFKSRKKIALNDFEKLEKESVKFGQWIFFSQYNLLKEYAEKKSIEIIGDIPIFVSFDSADAWASPEIFELDKKLNPINVAGVGPDYFSATGQLWGNPLYDWKNAKHEIFEFWRKRLEAAFGLYDIVRLDHFRGFIDYWAIPAESADASKGKWKIAPYKEFFDYIKKHFPKGKFIAEDLGLLSDRVVEFLAEINMPNMCVMQFAFGGDSGNAYLPHNINKNCVYYTGTHDNDTSLSWYNSVDEKSKDHFRKYFRTSGEGANWTMIHASMTSTAKLSVIPMQDILSLWGDARMNTPGKPSGNWTWRFTQEQLDATQNGTLQYVNDLLDLSGRLNDKK